MKKSLILIVLLSILLVSFTQNPGDWMKYPKVFNVKNFEVPKKPTSLTDWDYYYQKHVDTFWVNRIADVDSNAKEHAEKYANIMEFINKYRKSKGMTELTYSRKLSLEAELSLYYSQMMGVEKYTAHYAITHYINSKLFYAFQDRTEMIEKNIDFEKNISVTTEIVTGVYDQSRLYIKDSKEAVEQYKKYHWVSKFVSSPGHHTCMLNYNLNAVGICIKKFGDCYIVMIALGRDKNVVNENKPEFALYKRDSEWYETEAVKYKEYSMKILKNQTVEKYKFY